MKKLNTKQVVMLLEKASKSIGWDFLFNDVEIWTDEKMKQIRINGSATSHAYFITSKSFSPKPPNKKLKVD